MTTFILAAVEAPRWKMSWFRSTRSQSKPTSDCNDTPPTGSITACEMMRGTMKAIPTITRPPTAHISAIRACPILLGSPEAVIHMIPA